MDKSELESCLAAHPAFSTLGPRGIKKITAGSTLRILAANETLWAAGEKPKALCLVIEGMLHLTKTSSHGRTTSIGLLHPGDVFGCASMLTDKELFSEITAAVKSEVAVIPGCLAFEIGKANPNWFKALAVQLSMHFERQTRLRAINSDAAKNRIPALLNYIHENTGRKNIALTQAAVAKLTGLSEETVNRTLAKLKDRGILSLSRGSISIVNPASLTKLAAGG